MFRDSPEIYPRRYKIEDEKNKNTATAFPMSESIITMSESERVNIKDSILDALLSETSHDVSQQELRFIASRALGCAGAVIRDAGTRQIFSQ